MPPRSTAVGVKDLIVWTIFLSLVGALQQQPSNNAYPPHGRRDDLAKDAASVAHRFKSAAGVDSLQTSLSGHGRYRDTDPNERKQRTGSPINQRALATLSPPESNPAVRDGPAHWSSIPSAGLTSRHPARFLQDWQVEDIIILATVDGWIHARDRITGANKWQLDFSQPMVETVYHRHNKSVDEHGVQREDPLWIVEPSQDGAIYIYVPNSDLGMQNLGWTVKALAESGPWAGDKQTPWAYTADRKSSLYQINAATGNVLKSFRPGASHVNDDQSCRRVNPLDPLEEAECEPIGTLTLGKTEYTLSISDRYTGEQISTIKYNEWVPNNRDRDLEQKYTTTMDKRYVYTKYDGTIFGMDLATRNDYNPGQISKPIYRQKLASPVARVFDIVRPHDDPSGDAELVILPQPLGPSPYDGSDDDSLQSVFVNCTEDGSWYALSETKYPTVTEGAAYSEYSFNDVYAPPLVSLNMTSQYRKMFMGVHQISPPGSSHGPPGIGQPNYPPIDATPPEDNKGLIEVPPSVWDNIPSLKAMIIILCALLAYAGVAQQQQAGFLKRKVAFGNKSDITEVVPIAEQANEAEQVPMVREAEPAEETIFPHEGESKSANSLEALQDEESFETVDANDEIEGEPAKEGDEAKPKKKATRGKRGGRKQKDKEQQSAEARAKRANSQVSPESAVITVAASESPQVYGPLQINSLVIYTDKVIGQGSCGTSVFEGSFEGRDVAVKRMLSQYYDLASQEVSFLQQSDDHPNVIRYFCQQKDDHFLYIAVELCQASLFEVWEPEKAKTDARQLQLQTLKNEISKDVPKTLQQLAAGLYHLHNLRIIHRDIKPQNILVAFPKKNQNNGPRLVISDFGLGKNLPENVSTLVDPTGNAGTSGWKAPELISQPSKDTESKHSQSNSHTGNSENVNGGGTSGVKRAADIFSLGCLFFWVLTGGIHPYEDENGWQQLRELNIKRDNKKMDVLAGWSDAYEPMQLITWMLEHAPENRPTALQVLNHPFFWSVEKRLAFLCDCSDHFEREPRGTPEYNYQDDSDDLRVLENRAEEVIGSPLEKADFLKRLDRSFVDTLGRQRKYNGDRLLDLLRALRNKKSHYEDMPENVKKTVGPLAGGYLSYWCNRFPRLLMACCEVVNDCGLEGNDRFKGYFV